MTIVDGVTLVAAVSVKVLQDGDAYSALLKLALRLHGRCLCRWFLSVFMVFVLLYVFFVVSQMFWHLRLCEMQLCSTTFTLFARPGGRRI